MKSDRVSKNLKFKMDGLGFSVIPEKPIKHILLKEVVENDLHYHSMYELFYTDDESITVFTRGNSIRYENCLVCIPPFCKHRTVRKPGLRILFTYDKMHTEVSGITQFMNSFFAKTEPFKIDCNDGMKYLFKEIDCAFDISNRLSDEIIKSLLILIFNKIYSEHSLCKVDNYTTLNENYIIKIDDAINDFQSDVTVQSLAKELHLSTKQTTRILQKNYKKKLSEIMMEKRLTVATELLLRSNMTILEIVEYVNFSSERYFYLQFKKAFGCTPRRYRLLNKK